MKKFALPLGATALASILLIGGCDFLGDGGGKVEDNSPVLAVVNGTNITQRDLDSAIDQLPPNVRAMPMDQLKEPLMNTLIETQLLASEGSKIGLDDDQEFLHQLARFKIFSLREAYVAHVQEEAITDEALQAAYDEAVEEQELTKEVSASHILLETEDEAKEVIAQLLGGADFASLAEEKSIGPSSSNGGSLGFFKKNAMVEPFAVAAFNLEVGAITEEPVQTQFGWHVIKVDEIKEVDAPPFQSMRAQIEQNLSQETMEAKIEALRAAAEIELKYETEPETPPEEEAPAEVEAPVEEEAPAEEENSTAP